MRGEGEVELHQFGQRTPEKEQQKELSIFSEEEVFSDMQNTNGEKEMTMEEFMSMKR